MGAAEILKNKKAVSPIVGVALMVLLTIIFAYAIGSSSITGILQSYSTGLSMGGRLDTGELEGNLIKLEHNGGEPFTFKNDTKVMVEVDGDSFELNISNLYGTTLKTGDTVNLYLDPKYPEDIGKLDNVTKGDKLVLKVIDGEKRLMVLRQEVVV
ncbi:type IV pilin N-terminal domain-containing protein [Methanosarcina sp.]|jgi:flagellin-like protein|uniref:type IV pilin N-terminal domain-containing protein n=1 Tax=Methanosarcina sp. TaxID=2213 RepID=UPI002CD19FBD|nr:type IV pilin N-terminal domain-containing protein [Methanosarcina sp.]HOW13756.1 type IV pilin N-terminal domain-containing protein [Methanosarcina sp.]